MDTRNYFNRLLSISTKADFDRLALEVFQMQAKSNKIYSRFLSSMKVNPEQIHSPEQIPFLPVEFFKTHDVVSKEGKPELIFTSSGTTGSEASKHFLFDTKLYENVFTKIFEQFYGTLNGTTILALLPSYLERNGSSLVYMASKLIEASGMKESGFYLNEHDRLFNVLGQLRDKGQKTILLGVTFALLDFTEQFNLSFPQLIIMETGGMKGRRKEMIREEVHQKLCAGFGVDSIHSEYGMTELLSQAYSNKNGLFKTPPWMKIFLRDPYDPFSSVSPGATGGINIIDLANIDSCAFISTQDIGRKHSDDTFEVLGRFDFSELRGCNLLVE